MLRAGTRPGAELSLNLPLFSGTTYTLQEFRRRLDSARTSPTYLSGPDTAGVMVSALKRGVDLAHYHLRAYAVLPNHVHVLLLPRIPPSRLLRSLNGATAREANLLLRRTGEPFWQPESYDRWVHDEAAFSRIIA